MKTAKLLPAILVASMLCAVGASAQNPPATIGTYYENVNETIYQTKGLKMKLYVAPDPIYSPNFVTTGSINAESRWRWEDGATWSGSGTALKDWSNDNWVEIIPSSNMTIQVKERFGAAGCESNAATTKSIVAVDNPNANGILVENASEWIVDGSTYTKCQNSASASLSVNLKELTENGAPDNLKEYGVTYTISYSTADVNGNWSSSTTETTVTSDVLKTWPFSIDVSMKTNSGGAVVPTRYTIEFVDGTLQSKISRVSAKRAFIAGGGSDLSAVSYQTYHMTGETLIINLYPIPTTGPIYHIPNAF